jgi:hypothetical protein
MAPTRSPEPGDGHERDLLCGWLAFHRDALADRCDGVADNDLLRSGLGGSTMSLLGLVRHLTEMERVYAVWALGGGQLDFVYGPYEDAGPDGDFDDLTSDMVESSLAAWHAEREAADTLIAALALDDIGLGNRRTTRWNIIKLVQKYARHNGHADLNPPKPSTAPPESELGSPFRYVAFRGCPIRSKLCIDVCSARHTLPTCACCRCASIRACPK